MDKRGQGLSTNAIILIILGVAILVILIIGFTYVWGGLGKRISKGNVGTIISACQTACSTQSVYDYCSKSNELVADDGAKVSATCFLLENIDKFNKYGLESCPIDCKGVALCADVKYTEDGTETLAVLKAQCDTNTEMVVTALATDVDAQTAGKEACCIAK